MANSSDNFSVPREKLFPSIMKRLQREERKRAFRRLAFFSACFAGSLSAVFFAFLYFEKGLADSGFVQFFSLIFTDFSVIVHYWQIFSLTLIEAVPVAATSFLLLAGLALLLSLKELALTIKKFLSVKQFLKI
jgi:hypothetical protein